MKRVFALLMLMVMFLLVPGCGGDNSVTLTLDNYEDYLDVDFVYKLGSVDYCDGTITKYYSVDTNCTISPASSVFLYDDVTITLMLYGKIEHNFFGYTQEDFPTQVITIECNKGGKGSFSESYPLEECIAFSSHSSGEVSLGYQVLEVTGTVSRA